MTIDTQGVPSRAFAVTPSNTTEIRAMALYIGTGGNVAVETTGGDTVTFANVPDGHIILLSVSKVMAATTASDIIGMY